MSDPDAKYADIRARKKRVEWVKRALQVYWLELATHTGKWAADPTQSAQDQAEARQRARYYELVTECVRAFWQCVNASSGPRCVVALPMGLREAERRVKEVVMPKLQEARGLGVDRVWFLYGGKTKDIDDYVQEWFGAQETVEKCRALLLCSLHELCEYWAPRAIGLAGLAALKQACYSVYEDVWMVSESAAQWQLKTLLPLVWKMQEAREAFEAAEAAVTTSSAARAEVEKLFEQAAEDLAGLVTALEHARTDPGAASAATLAAQARLAGLMQRLQACG
jgi:hypothetical protein